MSASRRRVAVDLRALVPAPSGIGVFTRAMLLALARRGGFDYLGLAHRPPHHGDELRAAGIDVEHQAAPLGVLWQQLLLPRRLRRGDVDLLWSPITTLPVRSPVEGVATVHDLTALLLPETHRAKVRWSVLPFLRPTLERRGGWWRHRRPRRATCASISRSARSGCGWSTSASIRSSSPAGRRRSPGLAPSSTRRTAFSSSPARLSRARAWTRCSTRGRRCAARIPRRRRSSWPGPTAGAVRSCCAAWRGWSRSACATSDEIGRAHV